MMQNVDDAGRPRIVGLGVSATYHHVLMCCTCLHLSQLLVDDCHMPSTCNVPYWVIPGLLYAVSLVDDWQMPGWVPSGLPLLGYR